MSACLGGVEDSSLQVGDRLPVLVKPPITRTTLAYFCGASNDHNPVHIDIDVAREAGMEDVFVHGMLSMAYVGQMLTGWIPQEYLRSFEVKFGAIVHLGDELRCEGLVEERFQREGKAHVRIKLTVLNQNGDVKLTGKAVAALPQN